MRVVKNEWDSVDGNRQAHQSQEPEAHTQELFKSEHGWFAPILERDSREFELCLPVCRHYTAGLGKKLVMYTRKHQNFAAEAIGGVVVNHADGLHPGVDDDRAYEFEAAFLEGFRDFF